jgi:hypothetical protein
MPILTAIIFPLLINVVLYKKMCSTNEIYVHMSISFFQELFFLHEHNSTVANLIYFFFQILVV